MKTVEEFDKFISALRKARTDDENNIATIKLLEIYAEALAEVERLQNRIDKITNWCNAYPVKIFPEPDFDKVNAALKDNGISPDEVAASHMRYVITGIRNIATGSEDEQCIKD